MSEQNTSKSVCQGEQKKGFGDRIRYFMEMEDVPWELARIAAIMYRIKSDFSEEIANENALMFLKKVKETLQCYLGCWKKDMTLEEYIEAYAYQDLGYPPEDYMKIIKDYWISKGA